LHRSRFRDRGERESRRAERSARDARSPSPVSDARRRTTQVRPDDRRGRPPRAPQRPAKRRCSALLDRTRGRRSATPSRSSVPVLSHWPLPRRRRDDACSSSRWNVAVCSPRPSSLTGSLRAPIDAKARPRSEHVGLVVSANNDGDRAEDAMNGQPANAGRAGGGVIPRPSGRSSGCFESSSRCRFFERLGARAGKARRRSEIRGPRVPNPRASLGPGRAGVPTPKPFVPTRPPIQRPAPPNQPNPKPKPPTHPPKPPNPKPKLPTHPPKLPNPKPKLPTHQANATTRQEKQRPALDDLPTRGYPRSAAASARSRPEPRDRRAARSSSRRAPRERRGPRAISGAPESDRPWSSSSLDVRTQAGSKSSFQRERATRERRRVGRGDGRRMTLPAWVESRAPRRAAGSRPKMARGVRSASRCVPKSMSRGSRCAEARAIAAGAHRGRRAARRAHGRRRARPAASRSFIAATNTLVLLGTRPPG
jgi:hypothetical protein